MGGGETHCYSLSSTHNVDRGAALTKRHSTDITGVVVTALETAGQPDLFTADEDYFFVSVLPSNPQRVSLENYSVFSFQVLSH